MRGSRAMRLTDLGRDAIRKASRNRAAALSALSLAYPRVRGGTREAAKDVRTPQGRHVVTNQRLQGLTAFRSDTIAVTLRSNIGNVTLKVTPQSVHSCRSVKACDVVTAAAGVMETVPVAGF